MAYMEEKWSQMEAGHQYANGKPEAAAGSVNNQYMARMTQYYTEGNSVSTWMK